ncbi:flagellar basal-body MS-ring/collar protein FliF [Hydrogenivirga sp. 128-5-R1-1]|uniref:flagellar basal-body MS-ring/collar protein FliF n=1 Tax=Hydrogenivirga sp. 128-5-R1-1 TaxID=392423 RepID=UPI00015F3731|nr:flagellar basal-body MS-ring/collar protein FliF [Hydrogenivirga sp. 128-5-R1-1]EDP76466.1 Flagellar M-ring protein [Hydrogenivirga sp. 128-5-R1-1]
MADLNSTLKNIQERFSAMPLSQKALVVGLPAVIFSLLVTVLIYSLQPDYAVLYSNLSPEDMNAVLTELDKEGVKYKVGRDGRTILVPENKVRDVRLKLAAKGIPNKGVIGYELFDKSTIGLSEFQQRVNFKRAIEGELVRTILRFKNIEDARVHIALPEKSIFLRDEKEPSASVFIRLRPGAEITEEQVKAIRNLVAASIENLKPENVVVIDDKGRNLTANLDEGKEEISNKQLKIRREFEREIERKVQTALEEALGYGNVKVRVSVELDFTKVQRREETYDPDMTAVVSEQKRKEKTTGAPVGGVPGAAANIPPGTGAVQGQGGTLTEKKETITNYEVSKKEVISVDNTLKIKRLSVGVIINKELKDVNEESIKKIVSAAVGLDPKRGDTLSVVAVPFKKPAIAEEMGPPIPTWKKFLIPGVVGAVMALLLVFGLLRFLRKKEAPAPVAVEVSAEEVATISGAEALRETARELEIVKTITEVARKEPKKVAAMLKLWLREE